MAGPRTVRWSTSTTEGVEAKRCAPWRQDNEGSQERAVVSPRRYGKLSRVLSTLAILRQGTQVIHIRSGSWTSRWKKVLHVEMWSHLHVENALARVSGQDSGFVFAIQLSPHLRPGECREQARKLEGIHGQVGFEPWKH